MKLALILIIFFSCCSCTTSIVSPVTQVEYTGSITREGISITAKPPFWDWAVKFYESF